VVPGPGPKGILMEANAEPAEIRGLEAEYPLTATASPILPAHSSRPGLHLPRLTLSSDRILDPGDMPAYSP